MSDNLPTLSAYLEPTRIFDLRVNGCPVAVDFSGVVRESARLRNSDVVFACWSLTWSTTGPFPNVSFTLCVAG